VTNAELPIGTSPTKKMPNEKHNTGLGFVRTMILHPRFPSSKPINPRGYDNNELGILQ
tara:strand:- start:3492 stop:3665 length:174 start_codon:yes stop_codon:yes gene_type:complete